MTLRAIITAGGTTQPIDDVRGITNISKGGFGTWIARSLARHGVETTLLGSETCIERLKKREPFRVERFVTFEDLQVSLFDLIEEQVPDFIFMAAAVSDYTPIRQEGKMRSNQETVMIPCKRNPKILSSLREKCGAKTFLIGFKLLSGVSHQELVDTALAQVKGARLNLTVANDAQLINFVEENHPIVLVTPEGGAIPINGHRADVTEELVKFVLRRQAVDWFHTNQTQNTNLDRNLFDKHDAGRLLKFAQVASLLTDTNGNVSVRIAGTEESIEPQFLVSPRGVDKSCSNPSDLAEVLVNLETREIYYHGPKKSSIDSGVQGILYQHLPQVESFLHFHSGRSMVLADFSTDFPFPCGTVQEADAILAGLSRARLSGRYLDGSFMVELTKHGFLLALEKGGVIGIEEQWNDAKNGYLNHLVEIQEEEHTKLFTLAPVFAGARIVGVIAHHKDDWCSIWISEKYRGRGYGELVIKNAIEKGYNIGVHDRCGVAKYYLDRGYKVSEHRDKLLILTPPTRRDDLRESASICLVNPLTKKVLLGRRLVGAWKGFYSFPGGVLEKGESPLEAALREFREECGITLNRLDALASSVHYTGWNDGERAYRVHNYIYYTYREFNVPGSEELECGWFDIGDKLPMGIATKAVRLQVRNLMS